MTAGYETLTPRRGETGICLGNKFKEGLPFVTGTITVDVDRGHQVDRYRGIGSPIVGEAVKIDQGICRKEEAIIGLEQVALSVHVAAVPLQNLEDQGSDSEAVDDAKARPLAERRCRKRPNLSSRCVF